MGKARSSPPDATGDPPKAEIQRLRTDRKQRSVKARVHREHENPSSRSAKCRLDANGRESEFALRAAQLAPRPGPQPWLKTRVRRWLWGLHRWPRRLRMMWPEASERVVCCRWSRASPDAGWEAHEKKDEDRDGSGWRQGGSRGPTDAPRTVRCNWGARKPKGSASGAKLLLHVRDRDAKALDRGTHAAAHWVGISTEQQRRQHQYQQRYARSRSGIACRESAESAEALGRYPARRSDFAVLASRL
ncbi:hypothetical protein CMUS01_03546 [Colletotrichum musicola]|uniref:Uncharacterized protein n=1 Tax=Colletotrichum musicola TaxID=2175873 RepID=A0A8H6U5M3_9PEZI|nr:hypothetical protein CMUS01_03546 [Colletotrichum musicola]